MFTVSRRWLSSSLPIILAVLCCFALPALAQINPALPQKAEAGNYGDKITLGGGKTLSISFVLAATDNGQKIEKCTIVQNTRTKNPNGSIREEGNKHFLYDIDVASDGKFSSKTQTKPTPNFPVISGKISSKGITGSIEINGKNYRYSAKKGKYNEDADNAASYRSMGPTPYRSSEGPDLKDAHVHSVIEDMNRSRW